MALGWIGAKIALGSVARKAKQFVLAIGREADNRRYSAFFATDLATCSPRLAASMIVAKTELTTSFALALEMSSASATASTSSEAFNGLSFNHGDEIGVCRSAGCRRPASVT